MQRVSYFLLLFALVASPLAFGTVDIWAEIVLEMACFGGLFAYAIHLISNPKSSFQVPGLAPLALLMAYPLVQLIPLPTAFIRIISPSTYNLYLNTIGIINLPAWLTLSINPRATTTQFFHYAAFACSYVLATHLTGKREHCCRIVWLLVTIGFSISLLAILQKVIGNGNVLWVRAPPPLSSYTGPFVHKNQFAAYMEMLVPLALALFFYHQPGTSHIATLRQRITAVFNDPRAERYLRLGFVAMTMLAAILVSKSRGGFLGAVVGCLIVMIFQARQSMKKSFFLPALIAFSCSFFFIALFDWDPIIRNLYNHGTAPFTITSGRTAIWQHSLALIKDFSLTGTGLGTFGNIFPTYEQFEIYKGHFIYHAHNDYIEILADLGSIGFLLMAWFLLAVFRSAYIGYRRRHDSYARYLFIAALAGLYAQFSHLIFDYNLQSSAIGLTFFVLLALMVSGGHTRFQGSAGTSLPVKATRMQPLFLLLTSGLLLVGSLATNSSAMLANKYDPGQWNWSRETPRAHLEEIYNSAAKAAGYAPLNSYYSFVQADTANLLGRAEAAMAHYQRAIRLNPAQSTYLQDFGLFLGKLGQVALADRFFQASVRHDRSAAYRYLIYAGWLVGIGDRQKALRVYGQALDLDQRQSKHVISMLLSSGFTISEINKILPDRIKPQV